MLTQEKLRIKRFKKSQKRKRVKEFRLKHYGTIFYTPPTKIKKQRKITIKDNKITGVTVGFWYGIVNYFYTIFKKAKTRLSF